MRIALVNVHYPLDEDVDSIVFSMGKGVIYAGREEGVRRFEPEEVLDVDQRVVIPGLEDAHMHLYSTALSFGRLDLRNVQSIEDLKEKVRVAVSSAGSGEWIIGRGWDQDKMEEKRYPTRYDIDEVAPNNPVILVRVCGHAAVLNTRALEALGLLEARSEEEKFIQVEDGKPTGVVFEELVSYALSRVPDPPLERVKKLAKKLLQEYLSYGVVSLHSMSVSRVELEVVKSLQDSGEFIQEYRAYVDYSSFLEGVHREFPSLVAGVKIFADGSFGAGTAALRERYSDSETTGNLLLDSGKIVTVASNAIREGLEVAVHAIGDRALEEVLGAASRIGGKLRIEHASLTPPDILETIAELKPRVSVQPHFILSDTWIADRLGDRTKWVYAYRSLLATGAGVLASSDSPVEPINPWLGIYAALNRGKPEGLPIYRYTWYESLNFREALTIYSASTKQRSLVVLNVRDLPHSREEFQRVRAEKILLVDKVVSL
ncbi:amidohydrolase [Infirmifilum lucidum]|uniref:Amidohydrolase n=1 Tax=Infirmifilum lucidum TaxID=2776706 RepID=A0A7L9FI67_9CREN|nr:amidohydrolase [Infirmifilum lucidum]QOJ79528.1 amidohydrolase [Infirmifilum lucidum]